MSSQGGAGRQSGEADKHPFSQANINQTLKELRPLVAREARRIYRRSYLDDDDLVQEALEHIFAKSHLFDANKGASYKTWAMKIARNKLYNVALRSLRQARCPKSADGNYTLEVSWDAMEYEPCAPFCCPQPAQALEYSDLVESVARKLNPTARRVFRTLAEPPTELAEISRQEWISCLRKKKVGTLERAPKYVRVSTGHVAEHLGLTYSVVAKARRSIAAEIDLL